jgi:hypothetical protein
LAVKKYDIFRIGFSGKYKIRGTEEEARSAL